VILAGSAFLSRQQILLDINDDRVDIDYQLYLKGD
jgi:hypothetical protein